MSFADRFEAAHAELTCGELEVALAELLSDLQASLAKTDWPLDEGVLPVLAGLWRHGFWTTYSCEGHSWDHDLEEPEWCVNPPGVGIEAPNPFAVEGLHPTDLIGEEKQSPERGRALRRWQKRNLRAQVQLIDLLAEFYAERAVSYETQLHANNLYGGWIVQLTNVGAEWLRGRSGPEQARALPLFRAELQAFGEFLNSRALP